MTNFFDLPQELRDMVYLNYLKTYFRHNIGLFELYNYEPELLYTHPQISTEIPQIASKVVQEEMRSIDAYQKELDDQLAYWEGMLESRTGCKYENREVIAFTHQELHDLDCQRRWVAEFVEELRWCSAAGEPEL